MSVRLQNLFRTTMARKMPIRILGPAGMQPEQG